MKHATQTTLETVVFDIELTDTFGGEANYSWVKRATVEAPATITDRALIRRAKQAVGICGPHRKQCGGELIALYPQGSCIVCFIIPRY